MFVIILSRASLTKPSYWNVATALTCTSSCWTKTRRSKTVAQCKPSQTASKVFKNWNHLIFILTIVSGIVTYSFDIQKELNHAILTRIFQEMFQQYPLLGVVWFPGQSHNIFSDDGGCAIAKSEAFAATRAASNFLPCTDKWTCPPCSCKCSA